MSPSKPFCSSAGIKSNRLKRRSRTDRQSFHYSSLEARQLLAAITWSSGDITGGGVVSTNGELVFALSGSSSTGTLTTVNGVTFVGTTRADAPAIAQSFSSGTEALFTTLANDNGSAFEPAGLPDVGEIIRGAWWGTDDTDSASLTLTGLTIGDTYEVQLFANDARVTRDSGYITRLGNGEGGFGIDLELNNTPDGGRAGDFGLGTFVADASTQTFEISGFINGSDSPSRSQVNAIQLRNLSPDDNLLPGSVPLINEFSASNAGVIDDDNGNSSDWIEIYNAGQDSLNLAGYSLTDDPSEPAKFVFPSTPLAGGAYLVVFAGDDADPAAGTDIYTGFGLSSAGEYVGLYDPAGVLVSEFGSSGSDYPAQSTDVSYGLVDDGNFDTPSFFATPTPGFANAHPIDGVIDAVPTVSVQRGFYDQAFNVDIASNVPGASIAYTTDGTEPTFTNGTRVDPANANATVSLTINISQTTPLRTALVRDGFVTTDTTTHSYVFLDDVISSSVLDTAITSQYTNAQLRAGLLDIPTLSFNYETVIVDSDQPEQRASIEWLAPDGSAGFQIDAGIVGFGGNHISSQGFEKENYRVEFRNEYEGRLEFPLFEGFDLGIAATESFESVEFRGGSHDRILRGFGLANRFVDDTLLELGHVAPHGRFVHIYGNGEYFGQFHMRERWDADFLAQYYGGDEDDYEAVNGNVNNGQSTPNGWDPGDVYDGDGTAWANIQALADTDGSGNPTGGYQELKDAVNLPQYIDYTLLYMSGNTENEYRGGGSVDGSVPYTFFLNDADGWLRTVSDRTGNAGPGNIFGTLVDEADPEFMTLLADRIQNMFGEGGVLSAERSTERLQSRIDETALSFVLESARYSDTNETRTPDSFFAAANNAINNILPALPDTMLGRLRARGLFPDLDAPAFEIEGTFQNGGEIESGDLLTISASGAVFYTTDGSDPRLEGGGINPNIMVFDPTVTSSNVFVFGSDWRYLDNGSNQGTGWRSPGFNDNGWATGASELGYGDNPATTISFGNDSNNKHITTYFRKTFNVTDAFDTAELSVFYDDAAVVYLNGTEVGRTNISGTVNWLTRADSTVGNGTTVVFDLSDSLVLGTNTLAIEIHQAAPTSSDLSFNAQLETEMSVEPGGGVPLLTSTNVKARTFFGGQWSALRDATFVIPASQSDLRISEIHFNPADPTTAEIAAGFIDNDDFEFIELYNPNIASAINLSGVQLSNGVTFGFSAVDLLPGERAVVVEDIDAFMARYGDSATILGEWTGGLNNGGEQVTLVDSDFNEIMSVNYGDNDPWYNAADGHGFSLVLDDVLNTPVEELGKHHRWRASTEFGGTPGAAAADPSGVVINEILAHSDGPQTDMIELYNPTASAINIGQWYLSDEGNELQKYQIPLGTVIAAGGYLVFDESDFNEFGNGFALSGALGDQIYLSSGSGSAFVGLEDSVEFNATFNGESLGRLPNGSGRLTRLSSNSFGSVNGEAEVGPLVISEINYHPADPTAVDLAISPTLTDNDLEYIEIANPTSGTIDLTNWRLRGEADFDFAAGTSLAAGEAIVVVSFDPALFINLSKVAAFRAHYGLAPSVAIVGGFTGSLSNSSGRIALQQPDTPDAFGFVPRVVVDEVVYDDLAPWGNADGSGLVLQREALSEGGSFASSWTAVAATPGIFENEFLLGDVNRDGVVNFLDISPFIAVLADNSFLDEADINGDGVVDFLDISAFIDLLATQ